MTPLVEHTNEESPFIATYGYPTHEGEHEAGA